MSGTRLRLTIPPRARTALSVGSTLIVATLGFIALQHLLAEVRLRDIRHAVHAISGWRIVAALGFTCASYFFLTLYDVLALRVIGKRLSYRIAAIASFTSYTLSHNFGFALLTGGTARMRVYSANGLHPPDIVRIIAIASATFWTGVVSVAAIALCIHAQPLALASLTMPVSGQRWLGASLIAVLCVAMALSGKRARSLHLFRWRLPLPTARQALAQVCVSACDIAAASAALFLLVPGAGLDLFPQFFLAYSLALIVALFSHVPGGLGIFEAVIIAAIPELPTPQLVAALVLYRVIYYLLPLVLAALMLAVHEHRNWRRPVAAMLDRTQDIAASLAPAALSLLVFLGGAMLLVSGSLPAVPARLRLLREILPLPFEEASHIAASLSGTALLMMAPGLYRRLDGAFLLTRAILIGGAVFSLAKGIDYEEAIALLIIVGILQWARSAFYRHTAFTRESFSPPWLTAVALAVGLSVWIGIFAYKHVDYQNDLWWHFAWKGDAPRFLRASLAIAVFLIGVALYRLFGAVGGESSGSGLTSDFDSAFDQCERTDAQLAYTGDKRILTSADGQAFLMYQVQGDSWIVMSDPVGPREQWPDLLWRIRDMCDRAQGRLMIYQLSTRALPYAIDMGMQLVKYGEEARVDLTRFTLDGSDAKVLRYAERRAAREGACFEVVPAARVPEIMDELRAISDGWLKAKGQSEKAFSLGRFDPAYLQRFDCALVRREGRIVAFANIWTTRNREELSVDLMRHGGDIPYGTMDFLFINLMLWGRERGYRWFTLGLAPLSGIESRRLAPFWARIGHLLYKHGEALYGFEGLRSYKDKFGPVWEPRFIAGPHGLSFARAMIDLLTLISGRRASAASKVKLSLVA